jgi:hypothetical protein
MTRRVPQITGLVFAIFSTLGTTVVDAADVVPSPDFSGMWGRNSFDFEPAPSGPRPTSEKGLQVSFTVDDPEMFTTPWSATVTYSRVTDEWLEYVCAENPGRYFGRGDDQIPRAEKPDF